ncbi:hypothetical protein DSO57_1014098 [Entomophthora muscae]|uniref:Uncharacterized protein n=1 Tax=Entomophthora muscae TaxID=34485 RepID=A0ACC2UQV7_9FUNG|nr:hypothetical protein DSO57_1014098 [Entomophthora muscae]
MIYSIFSFAAFIAGATLAGELQQTKCTDNRITPIGMYAFPMFTNATNCYEGTVRCIAGGYEKCTKNKFVYEGCEVGYTLQKTTSKKCVQKRHLETISQISS